MFYMVRIGVFILLSALLQYGFWKFIKPDGESTLHKKTEIISVDVVRPPPPPPPAPKAVDLSEQDMAKPNKQLPLPTTTATSTETPADNAPPPIPVFGISMSSTVSNSASSVTVPVGNTLMTDPKNRADPSQVQALRPIPASRVSKRPLPLAACRVPYPSEALDLGLEGQIVLSLDLNDKGQVVRVHVVKGVHPLLNRAAQKGMKACRFSPAKQGNQAVPVVGLTYIYTFVLD